MAIVQPVEGRGKNPPFLIITHVIYQNSFITCLNVSHLVYPAASRMGFPTLTREEEKRRRKLKTTGFKA
jgi:hypothetical protein